MVFGLEQPKELCGYETLWREWGYFLSRREKYEIGLQNFDIAVSKTPASRRALYGRAYTRAKLCLYAQALEDINATLALCGPNELDLPALALRALITYLSCEFEDACVQNVRMINFRKKPDDFVMGAMNCSDTIENCLGERAGRPLRDYFKIIRKLAWKRNRESKRPAHEIEFEERRRKKARARNKKRRQIVREPVAPKQKKKVGQCTGSIDDMEIRDSLYTICSESDYVPPLAKPFPFSPLQKYTSNIRNYMAEKYLDRMYLDKIFLQNFKFDPGAKCPNKAGSKKLLHLTKDGFKQLHFKQEVLRTRRPFYFIKYQEARLSRALRARMLQQLRKVQKLARHEAETMLEKIKEYIEERETKLALEQVEKLKEFCEIKEKRILPLREKYLLEMYDLACQIFLDLKRITPGMTEWDIQKRILWSFGLPLSREPSRDSIYEQFQQFHIDTKKHIAKLENRLRKSTVPEEMAWLYHELARFQCDAKQPELARVYARKCISESKKIDHIGWQINAMYLLVRVNMQHHNKNDAKNVLNEAIVDSKQLGNEAVTDYLEKALEVVETAEFEDTLGSKVIEKREKQIIEMVAPAGLKDDAAFLFKKMDSMPASRRMSVMPGVKPQDATPPKASARKMSILPGKKDDDDDVKKEGKGKKLPKGVAFLELVQYYIE